MTNKFLNIKTIFVFVILVGLLFVGLIIQNIKSQAGKIPVTIYVVPKDAKITVDGNNAKAGKVFLTKDKHTIKAKKTGFKDTSETITLGEETRNVYLLLAADSSEALDWSKKHAGDYSKTEGLVGEETVQNGVQFQKTNPIVKLLPYHSLIFNIDYSLSKDSNGVVLQIKAGNSIDRSLAIGQIRNWGYDPSDFEIVFTDYANPFNSEVSE